MTWLDMQDQKVVNAELARRRSPGKDSSDERFELWMALVDKRFVRTLGISMHDMSDWRWRDSFDNGDSPAEAMRGCLEDDDMSAAFLEFLGEE